MVEGEEPFQEDVASSPAAAQRSVPGVPSRTASGNMWKNTAPSIAPAEKLR